MGGRGLVPPGRTEGSKEDGGWGGIGWPVHSRGLDLRAEGKCGSGAHCASRELHRAPGHHATCAARGASRSERGRFCAAHARQYVSGPVPTLNTPHHRGSIRPQGNNSRFRQQSGIFSVKHGLF